MRRIYLVSVSENKATEIGFDPKATTEYNRELHAAIVAAYRQSAYVLRAANAVWAVIKGAGRYVVSLA